MAQAERIVHDRTEGVRMFFWTVRRPVQDFCGIARGSSSPARCLNESATPVRLEIA
ncbi:hypothetical protein BLIF_0090 [Bifidobacterium longum subsp. infantis 157F]|nr:hypothetical protein BLIF_0090 [Bifidobacterium longum subsp. infantis 157F]